MSVLTDNDKAKIIELFDSEGYKQADLATMFKTSRQYIHQIVRYRGKPFEKLTPGPNPFTQEDYEAIFHESYNISNTGCWEWNSPEKNGYGRINNIGAHRFSWKLYNGDIPEGKIVRHKCNNNKCVNPDHLCLGTDADNMLDKKGSRFMLKELDEIVSLIKLAESTGKGKVITKLQIGKRFDISQMTIWRMRKARQWPCIDGVYSFNWK